MQSKHQTVKLRVEIVPGLPGEGGTYSQSHAFRAMLDACYRALTAEKVYPETIFTGTSDGVTARLAPIHFTVRAEPTSPPTYVIECVGKVTLEGDEATTLEAQPVPLLLFPMEQTELEAVKDGRRSEALVPVLPDFLDLLKPGASVTFYEAAADPFGNPVSVAGGDRFTVSLARVKDQNYQWVGHRLYLIAWDPATRS
jgi:hypothetical protein